ncbi:MAG: LysM peptidoglycan-binding domain-containing protein, partial [candidate division Zixibacteria bacterium]|nr:LysM peptidoglycan-binding domain-containing protein [candidate division Zixibacteria bacterium]
QVSTPVDSAEVNEELISEDLKESEYYYALGVEANQKGDWEKAQSYFEKALDILANLNLDEEIHSKNIDKYNRLLKEIASDYKITLLSLGLLEDETSISAFLEKFGDIENFQGLRESLDVKIEYSDTAVTTYDMPIEWNERVENSILYLQTIAREAFIQYLSRSGKYIDIAREILKEKNMPLDLAYLPLIESGYNPRARSWANAVGMWQFIPSTGRIYGLKSNWWYDEKRDFIKSTYAACNYLNKLYNDFGCWKLALAAYNCGEGGLSRAIKKYHTTNFWELNLRKQTYDYVPLYMAATIIAKNPQKYGFDIEYEKPLKYDMVNVDKPVELKTISDILNVSAAEIRDLNPEILRDVTPPQYQDYKLRIPAGTKELFEQKYAELPAKKLFAMHKVRKGETISGIARSYGIPTYSILQANTLSKRAVIYPGQYLKIPGEGQVDRNYSASADAENKNQKTRVSKNTAVRGYEVYKIKSGDNLVYIAGKFNTTVSALEKLNGIDRNQILKVGQRLRIPSDQSYQIYKVRSGDNLSSIAKKFNTTVKAIKQSNNMSRSNRIIAGEKLRIPVKSQGDQQQELLVHKVEIGETLWGIARIFGVPLEKILEWNDLSNPSYVQAGDKIKIFIAR